VHVAGHVERPHERTGGAGGDRDVGAARQRQHPQGVVGRGPKAGVATDGGHGEELELGSREAQDERKRVVMAGIAIEHERDPLRHRWSMPNRLAMRYDAPSVPTGVSRYGSEPSRPAEPNEARVRGLEEDTCTSASA
jgi:hypothetical protein